MIGIILVMHEDLGDAYIRCATTILDEVPPAITAVRIDPTLRDAQTIQKMILSAIRTVDSGDGILILTDLFGATPCNACSALEKKYRDNIKIIAGLNFPMLLKLLTNRTLSLTQAAEVAIEAGKRGIIDVINMCCCGGSS